MDPTPRNIVFILTDQERYLARRPEGLETPGREWLEERGVTFTKHYIASTYCTSSRSVIYTGRHMPITRMFDNANFAFVGSMNPRIPTIGSMLREVGYYTAYKGKWHLAAELEPEEGRDHNYAADMEPYGFSDWNPTGDVIGDPLDGFHHDNGTMVAAIEWLRTKGLRLRDEGTPWFLSIDLVNPHDIMYFNTDLPGERIQDPGDLLFPTSRAPETPTYDRSYAGVVPGTFAQPLDDEGRPAAHAEFEAAMAIGLGRIPAEADRWQRFNDYYFNCIREVDRKIERVIRELDDLGLLDDTVIVFSSDHGEMGGAHGMRGKGGNAYEESIHVPLVIVAPDGPAGVRCDAVTSHVDLAPTFLNIGRPAGRAAEALTDGLPGRDLTPLVYAPTEHAAGRDAALFTYSGVMTLDAVFIERLAEVMARGGEPSELRAAGIRPDFGKRGFQRTVIDGRYKFSRYFAPARHHMPDGIDQLRAINDIELFDLVEDPHEMTNLAALGSDHDDLIARLNHRLNTLLREEIGAPDDGRYLPDIPGMNWVITEFSTI
ncbi:MAG: sulfatase-like hydrolase/transferase [Acidimicrobiia bacterium]